MNEPTRIPVLRSDLEFQFRDNNTVDVRDPHLLQIYTLDADDFRLAQAFDGSDADELRRRLRAQKRRVTASQIQEVAEEFDELRLLDKPEVWDEAPNVDNIQPYSQINTRKGLKVLPTADPAASWTCNGCGSCCHGLAVEISAEEESRIDARLYKDILRDQSFAEDSFINADEPAKRTLRQREKDLACIFLAPNGLCYVHARQGMEAKPDACQMFPAMVMLVPNGPARLGLRTNCASMYQSFEGPKVSNIAEHILRIVAKGEVHKAPKEVKFFRRTIPFARLDRICQDMRAAFDEDGVNAETVRRLDAKYLGGRARKGRRRYAKLMLDYIAKEASGPAPVEEGAYGQLLRRLGRGTAALWAMREGRNPPQLRPRVERFVAAQIGHAMYLLGPINLPDAGYALTGFLLALEAAMFAIGETGGLKTANVAFEVFMGPLLETTEHSWPILDALDAPYAARLREEIE